MSLHGYKVTAAYPQTSFHTHDKGILPLNFRIPRGQDGNGDTACMEISKRLLAEKHPPWSSRSSHDESLDSNSSLAT